MCEYLFDIINNKLGFNMENNKLKIVIKNIRDGFKKAIRDSNCKNNDFSKLKE